MNERLINTGNDAEIVSGEARPGRIFQSGVIPSPPPPTWAEVREYLRSGEHGDRVKEYAARHPGFAYVLELLAAEEQDEGAEHEGGVVIPFSR